MNVFESAIKNQFSISKFGEYYLPSINRDTFEKIDSKTVFQQRFKDKIFKPDTLHIIIGLDSGLLANHILKQELASGSKYLFIELDDALAMLNIEIESRLDKYIKVLSLSEFTQELDSGDYDLYLIKDQCLVHHSMGSTLGIIEQYSSLINIIQKQLSLRTVDQKSQFEQKHFLIQQLYNIADNQYPASMLRGKFIGKSCIVIGGGPSLDEHIDWIKNNYQDLFIITVSRMAARLSQEGVPAHIIVSVDPQNISFEINRDMMELANESLFINSHHVNHRILSQWLGKSLYLGTRLPWLKEDFDNIPTIGPTVTNSAVRIAIELGFKTILLTGADFCYSSVGVSHAKGTVEAKSGINNSFIGEWVETYAGNNAETPIQLVYAAAALSEEALLFPEVEIINLSENAAKLKGISHKCIETIELVPAQISPFELLKLIPDHQQSKASHLKDMFVQLGKSIDELKVIKELAKKAIALNLQAKSVSTQSNRNRSIIAKVDKIEKRLNGEHNEVSQAIKFYGYYEFSKFLTTKEASSWSEEHMHNMTHQYYNAFETFADEMSHKLQKTISLVKARQSELTVDPDLATLVNHWRDNNQPGRVLVVEQLRTKLKLPYDSHSDQLQQITAEYQSQLTSMKHPYFSLDKLNTSLHNTFTKISDLYKSKNKSGLSQVVTSIEPLVEDDCLAQRLYYLAQSYLAILNDDNQTALSCLQAIEPDNQTEVEQKQILVLALKLHNIDLAEQTLEQIISYSDEYLPQYAHVLTLQGKNQQALNTYLDFLDKYPTDISVLLKLGIFLAEMGQIDGARASFNQVLSIDPTNLTASDYLQQLQG
ncbi:hypothetical protein TUM4438_20840 [Shewanella sairae]|uniref:6-hydroxymethylpterin diphosphokinase MptE-like domain-containing protein n=1 Tax=Shewanella sairae TaxID=190310 RepID=A0ABQ4PEQ2_9GAMM|nr:6-hydroxymethylpterin diphosphokinase MptE-like protein [Shewanella sairae]MCL1129281.1 DUF115 domain-containing protein [Shewanella sairae]GIU46028.1 hypothetical protein TUM4438_20840 [Shewanella sairae]